MKKPIVMIAGLIALLAGSVNAEMLAVSTWSPTPGNVGVMFQSAKAFQAEHQRLGAEVRVIQSMNGTMAYSMRFDSWQDWSDFGAKVAKDKKLQQMIGEMQGRGSSMLQATNFVNILAPAKKIGTVFETFIWRANPGKGEQMFANAMRAKEIHENAGIHVAVGVDKMQNLIYLTSFDNWDHYAKTQEAGPSEEFEKFWAEASADPSAQLINVITGSEVQ